jgi:prepilin-type N-terminal cleavage/methylation domain-containing protein/prepilin-type processing-associated H-X9-DG protein
MAECLKSGWHSVSTFFEQVPDLTDLIKTTSTSNSIWFVNRTGSFILKSRRIGSNLIYTIPMKYMPLAKKDGFTLVELLVVIVIIAALAALSFAVGPRMMLKARANAATQNLRQLGPLISTYASDHEMKLPPAKASATQPDGTIAEVQWNEICLALLYPDTPPGYAINEMIPENLALASTGMVPAHNELLGVSVPLAAIADPGRTPLIAPCDNFFFRYDEAQLSEFRSGTFKELLSDGKVPVLFVDGHIEAISPSEYLERKLFLVPIVPVP